METNAFFGRRPHDPRFCFELFRRAIVERLDQAWRLVYEQYSPLVTRWARRHPAFAACGEEAQYIVNRAFDRMWSALTPERFGKFPDLKSLLRYLQMCVHSIILDALRRAKTPLLSLDDTDTGLSKVALRNPVSLPQTSIQQQEFWQLIRERLKDELEEQVVYASFVLGLKPREICAQYGNLFPDVRQVYRVKENVLARLRRDSELQRALVGDA
jgi:RNA polymerase sigma factor (sigma-70 family)